MRCSGSPRTRRCRSTSGYGCRRSTWQPLDERLRLPPIDLAAVDALVASLADHRPDLIALQLVYRSEEEKMRAAILAQFPALVFGGTGGRDTTDVRSAGPQITMDLPIFDRNQGKIASERATRQKLHDEFAARLATAKGEVRGMLAEVALLARQINAARKQIGDLRRAATEAEPAYRAGNIATSHAADFHGEWNYAIAPRATKSLKLSLSQSQS
jgi:outer membrane protein TolC